MCCGKIVNTCLCSETDPCSQCIDCKCPDNGCPIELDTTCVFYNLNRDSASGLDCLGIVNGTSLKVVLEAIDDKLCSIAPYDFTSYLIPCLRAKYVVTNFKQFAEATDKELCFLKSYIDSKNLILTTNLANLNNTVLGINFPSISDCGTLGLLPTDTISITLQKFANKICTILSTCCVDDSPSLSPYDSNTIGFLASGTKNHTLTGNVKVSAASGNLLTVNSDGLYCTVAFPSTTQQLTFNSGTSQLCLTNGGNCVTIPNLANQLLSFNCSTKILTISGGNTVDLTCLATTTSSTETSLLAVDTSTINFTTSGTADHILTGNVIIGGLISGTGGNALTTNAGLLYVPPSTDEKVKVRAADTTPGYLEDKIIGLVNTLIATTVTTNTGTYKSEVNSVLDVAALISNISSNSTFKTAFTTLVKSCMCYTFRIANTSGSATTYDYVDCTGASHTGLALAANTFVDVCGRTATTPLITTIISNLGNC